MSATESKIRSLVLNIHELQRELRFERETRRSLMADNYALAKENKQLKQQRRRVMSEEQEGNEELPEGVSLCEDQPAEQGESDEKFDADIFRCPACSVMNTVEGEAKHGEAYKCSGCGEAVKVRQTFPATMVSDTEFVFDEPVIHCPECGFPNNIGDTTEGTTYKCVNCDATITVE